jgi:DNA-binding response OmpR family regulator
VLSRETLINTVWGMDFDGDAKTLDVHIRWLRAKIELIPAVPRHIVTVRGVGFRFD